MLDDCNTSSQRLLTGSYLVSTAAAIACLMSGEVDALLNDWVTGEVDALAKGR